MKNAPTEVIADPDVLETMKERGGTWAAYQNNDLSSKNCGHLKFLRYGAGCTYDVPPERYPALGSAGWAYLLVGTFDPAKVTNTLGRIKLDTRVLA